MINASWVIVNQCLARNWAFWGVLMLFMKLQFIFHHHLISHVEDAIEDDMGVIFPEWLGGGKHANYIIKASVWSICVLLTV